MKNIKLNILKNEIIGKVPEEFFGHFIEYMYDCIEQGLWAQILKTRSFERVEKTGIVSFEPWKCFGENILCELDSSIIYAPSYSVHIVNNGNEYGGIKQENLKLLNEE